MGSVPGYPANGFYQYNILNPALYGAVPGIDSTNALNTLFQSLSAGTDKINPAIQLDQGDYIISDTILVPNSVSNFALLGQGSQRTRLLWAGPAGIPMIKLYNCRKPTISGLSLLNNTVNMPSCALQSYVDGTRIGAPAATNGRLSDLSIGSIDGANNHGMTQGILFNADLSQSTAYNNDEWLLYALRLYGILDDGISFEMLQSQAHIIIGCDFSNCLRSAINNYVSGITGGQPNAGGSYQLDNCTFESNGSDFRIGHCVKPILAQHMVSEGSSSFISCPATMNETDGSQQEYTFSDFSWGGPNGTPLTFDSTVDTLRLSRGHISTPSGTTVSIPTAGAIVYMDEMRGNINTINNVGKLRLSRCHSDSLVCTITNTGVLSQKDCTGSLGSPTTAQINGTYTAKAVDRFLQVVTNSSFALTLPAVATIDPNDTITIVKLSADANTCTVTCAAGDTIGTASGNVTTVALTTIDSRITVRPAPARNATSWVQVG